MSTSPSAVVKVRRAGTGLRLGGFRAWLLPLFVLALYAYPFAHFEILRSPNELSRLYQVRAIVDDHSLSVNGAVRRYGPMGDLSEFEGRMYPNKAPGLSFLGAPIYFVVRALRGGAEHVDNRALLWFLRFFCCALPTVLVLRPLRRHAARVCGDARAAELAVLVFALGSLAFTYSLLFFSHQLAAVLGIASFLCFERTKERGGAGLQLLGGLFAGFMVVTEYTALPVAAILALYGLVVAREKGAALVRIAAGAAPCVLALAAYHHAAWGSALSTGYAHVQNQTFAGWHAQGFMGVTTPNPVSLLGNLFSPARGLFMLSPALLLALPGLVLEWRESRADAVVAAAVTAFYFFLAAAFLYEAWGWILGPRHLAPLIPFLVAPLACTFAYLRRRAASGSGWALAGGAGGGLAAAAILTTGLCTAVYPHIPDEFSAAVAHLVWPLARGGYLPYNLARVALGTTSTATWIPWFVALAGAALYAIWLSIEAPRRGRGFAAAVVVLGLHVLLLAVLQRPASPQELRTRAWIMDTWEPSEKNVRRGLFPP